MDKRRPRERWEREPGDESDAAVREVFPEYIHFSPSLTLGKPAVVVSHVRSRWLLWRPLSSEGRSLSGCFPSPAASPTVFSFISCLRRLLFAIIQKGNVHESAIERRRVTKIGVQVDQFLIDFCAEFRANRISGSKVTGRGLLNRAKTVE